MSSQNEQMQATMTQQLSQIQQHKDQYNILKLKLGGFHPMLCNLMKKETSCSQEKDIVTDVKNDWAYFSVEIILLLFDVISMITFKDLLNCFGKRFQIYFVQLRFCRILTRLRYAISVRCGISPPAVCEMTLQLQSYYQKSQNTKILIKNIFTLSNVTTS